MDPTLDLGGGCGSGKATRLNFYAASLELSGLVYRGQKELTSAGELVESIQCCSQADDDCRFRPHGLVH